MNERDETTLGRFVRLPERLPERQVLDAEIVEDDHLPVLANQRDLAHDAGQATLRHALYLLASALVVKRRMWTQLPATNG